MTALDDRLRTRAADKAQALGALAAALAAIDAAHREPDACERLCFLRAFALLEAGCYLLAAREAGAASAPQADGAAAGLADEPTLRLCTLAVLFEALRAAMGETPRAYPHCGPVAMA